MGKEKTLPPLKPVHANVEPYLEELRKRYGGTVYEQEPYVEVFQIRENLYAMFAPCTHAVGDNWLYLIDGPEKAMFIDTGYGLGDLKGLGEMLTGKPVIAANTHCHGAHSGGNAQFDQVYCHEYCAEMLKLQMYPGFWDKFNHVGEEQHRHYYRDEDRLPFREYEPIPCANHHIINLGGDYDIELIHTGGHSPGLCCFLDKKSRILYSGDAVFESVTRVLGVGLHGARPGTVHAECLDVRYYLSQMEALAARVTEYDLVMSGHGHIESPAQIVPDVVKATRAVIADPDSYDLVLDRGGRKTYIKSGGLADVLYDPVEIKKILAEG